MATSLADAKKRAAEAARAAREKALAGVTPFARPPPPREIRSTYLPSFEALTSDASIADCNATFILRNVLPRAVVETARLVIGSLAASDLPAHKCGRAPPLRFIARTSTAAVAKCAYCHAPLDVAAAPEHVWSAVAPIEAMLRIKLDLAREATLCSVVAHDRGCAPLGDKWPHFTSVGVVRCAAVFLGPEKRIVHAADSRLLDVDPGSIVVSGAPWRTLDADLYRRCAIVSFAWQQG